MTPTTRWILTSPLATMEIATTGGSCVAGGRLLRAHSGNFPRFGHWPSEGEENFRGRKKIESKLLVLVMLSQTI